VTEREQDKDAARLAILRHAAEVTGNVALTCRYYGITRQAFYQWRRRYEAGGLAALRDRSRRPRNCPHETSSEIVGKIIYLRQNYHFGPAKIAMYLKRYHDVQISDSGVWRILKRLDMNRLPASQRYKSRDRRWKRYEKQLPGHHVQIDVKFITPLGGPPAPARPNPAAPAAAAVRPRRAKYYPYTAIDDCTRLRVLRIYDRNNQQTAIQFADYVIARLPFPVQTIQTDTAPNFSRRSTGTSRTWASGTATSSPPPHG
jgi:transposase